MPQARDEAGNVWEVDAQGNPVRLLQAAQGRGSVMSLPRSSEQQAADARAARSDARAAADQMMQAQRFQWEKEKHDQESGGGTIPGDSHLTGDAYLKSLPQDVSAQVRALADGRMAFPTGKAAASPYWQQRMAAVAQYDPSFDTINYNARAATRRDFTSGKSSANIKALNTAIGHLGQLGDQIAGTASHGGFPGATTLNRIENAIARSSGASGITKFEQTAGALAGELTQVYRNSGGAEADIQRYLSELDSAQSLEQKKSAVANMAALLKSRLDAINDQYVKGMGTTAQPLQVLDPHAVQTLSKYLPGFDPGNYSGGSSGGSGGPTGQGGGSPSGGGPATPWNQLYMQGGAAPQGAAAAGSNMQGLPIDPRMQTELDSYVQANAGNLKADNLKAFISTLYGKYGGTADPAALDAYARQTADIAKRGGTINTQIPPNMVPLTGLDKFRNDLVNNPVGAGIAGFADAAGFGIPTALAPEKTRALSDVQSLPFALGQIGGSIAGTEGIGMFGRQATSRLAPSLLGGGVRSAMARNLATDASYSGIYGANQGNDPLSSALLGTAGSLVGSGLAKAGGAAIGGLAASDAANYLRSRGIPLTVGQMLGGIPKRIEDAAMSAPGVGDVIANRRMEGLNAFNQAAFQDAGAPIGFSPTAIRRQGIDQLLGPEGTMGQGAVSNAYDQATAGVSVPLDPQFMADMGQVAGLQTRLPSDYAARFDKVGENRIAPIVESGIMTGEGYQQAMRGLKGSRASAAGAAPGFEQEYRDALTASMDALRGNMQRQGGQGVIDALGQADQANRYAKTLEDAVKRARNGSRSGEVQVFTPSQLIDAGTLTASRYPGPRPFAALADAGQEVLPSRIPDSGTARRLSQLALPGVLGGAGYTLDRASGDDGMGGVLSGLGTAALLAAGGTKGGQKALQNVIFVRPEALRAAGRAISQRSGMFGAGFIPLALPLANQ